ncbi:hypothetical protein CAPN002_05730 [Capnocytophaga stomatis]|uniref:hypothetical protein n=1 Tax=Capnocytophaga stomatis TaxID=1848904 RepID=UPI001951EB0F|nr:hypothetical protein [Capnocytophaga stomatis]GIJ93355.1 hypothetical protein CAPN002_05730 [Capnocytophaga stomatis]
MNTHLFSVLGEVVPQWTKLSEPLIPNYNCTEGGPVVIAQSWGHHNASQVKLRLFRGQTRYNSAKVVSAELNTSDVKLYAKMVSGNFYEYKKPLYDKLSIDSYLTSTDTYTASWGQPIEVKKFVYHTISFAFTDIFAPQGELIQMIYIATHIDVVDYVTHPSSDDLGIEYVDTKKMIITTPARIGTS